MKAALPSNEAEGSIAQPDKGRNLAESITVRRCALFAHIAGPIAMTVGSLALVGWLLGIGTLTSVLPGFATMKPNTAFCFVLAGFALWLLRVRRAQSDQFNPKHLRWAQFCAALVSLVGLLILAEYLLDVNLGLDGDLGRMALATAFGFTVLGLALLLLEAKSAIGFWFSQSLALVVLLVGGVGALGYIHGARALYNLVPYNSVALHTALLFVVLS